MPKKKHVRPGVQALLDKINATATTRELDALMNELDALAGGSDEASVCAADLSVWRAYRARFMAIAGHEPPIPDSPLAHPDEQAGFRDAVARLDEIKREIERFAMMHPNPGVHLTPDVRDLERTMTAIASTASQMANRCRAMVRRAPFSVLDGGRR
jgi:hypothetical protein